MAYESEYHHAICATGALAVVCKVLRHTSNEDVYQNVCCLFGPIGDCEEARDIIRKGKGLEPVLETLQSDACRENQGLMQMVIEALHKTAISPANCEVHKSHGAVNLVLDRLHEGVGESIVYNILGFLAEMTRTEACRQSIRASDSLLFIMDYMLHDIQFIKMKAAVATSRMGADKDSTF